MGAACNSTFAWLATGHNMIFFTTDCSLWSPTPSWLSSSWGICAVSTNTVYCLNFVVIHVTFLVTFHFSGCSTSGGRWQAGFEFRLCFWKTYQYSWFAQWSASRSASSHVLWILSVPMHKFLILKCSLIITTVLMSPANYNNNCWGLTFQNHGMITREAVVEGSGSLDHLGFFNAHLNLKYTGLEHIRRHRKCGRQGRASIPRSAGLQSSTKTTWPPWRVHQLLGDPVCFILHVLV